MEIFLGFIRYFNEYLIKGIFISVLVVIIVQQLLKNKARVSYAAKIIKWILIIYAIASLVTIPLDLIVTTDSYAIINRATGPYWFIYWFLLIVTCVLPLTLFSRKLGANLYFLLVVAILMNIGWMYELFAIHMTSSVGEWHVIIPFDRQIFLVFSGLFVGIIVLVLGEMFQYWKVEYQRKKL